MNPDRLTPEERSERMSRIRGRHTKPELIVRKLLSGMGFRYRLHHTKLPGRPDIVFPGRQKVIFVHGCFWHQHSCGRYKQPKTRPEFWVPKLISNVRRDHRNQREINRLGWKYRVVWECELKNPTKVARRLRSFLAD
ncbi:very short patch repair endonuclease [Dyella sp. 2HG41-7]|uniref:very short patch repair endonuclease n=1 Tax=Dyella sp. 2HG41-7 TaxID=2883239 RepID=UPI0021045F81|nr:very short patch repair endonuclease [Dyella sp. 2HG41-7]